MQASVITLENKKVGDIQLNDSVFGVPVREDIIQRVILWQPAKRRNDSSATKGISAVSGTTAKPHPQKGTGRARAGTRRAPQHRGGGIVFGPVVRSYEFSLPKKVRKLGLKSALSSKAQEGNLFIVKDLAEKNAKTKDLAAKIESLNWENVLFIGADQIDESFRKAASNLKGVDVLPQQGANVYDIIKHKTLVLTEEAAKKLEERLSHE